VQERTGGKEAINSAFFATPAAPAQHADNGQNG
jgi:hypothetical protein